ncbi:glycosyltransferase [Flavivirga aquimarina]|uniref:Glycosyltransferase n=1 Tax=Flavivirga aquimarina TaxID=2027862 RepID=A0ABT8WBX5_9FLAO|nr:glycosyltransferase [Flavivirga aquimarina]MDO5970567.1 glycosyltransferase [Flavivirga aquimarina]
MKNNIKEIVFVLGSYPHDSETFITNQIIYAIEAGYDVKISVTELNTIKGSSQEALIEKYNLLSLIHIRSVKVPKSYILKVLKCLALIVLNLDSFKIILKIFTNKRKDKIKKCFQALNFKPLMKKDVFHIQFANNSFFLADYKKQGFLKKNSNLLVTFHGWDAHFNSGNLGFLKAKYKELFENVNAVILSSNYLKEKLIALGCDNNKIKIIPNGVDAYSAFPYKEKQIKTPVSLLSVGRIVPLKGHIFGVKVVEKLVSKGLNVNYTIIGDGDFKKELKRYIDTTLVKENINLVGTKTQTEIIDYLHRSDLFLMTSVRDEDGRSEAFGLVTIEAQSTGTPVIAFDTGGVKETVKEGFSGYLVKEKDVETMAEKILLLVNNTTLFNELSKNARTFVEENFNKDLIFEKHEALYNMGYV